MTGTKDAYHTFTLFQQTLDNWLLLNWVKTDSEDHLCYVFTTLWTKAHELHTQWTPTGTEEEQKAIKATTFLMRIQDRMMHELNMYVQLAELEDIIAKPNKDHQELVSCIKTIMDWCEIVNNAYCEHELCHWIVWGLYHSYILTMQVPNSNETLCASWAGIPWVPWSYPQGRWTTLIGYLLLPMPGNQMARSEHPWLLRNSTTASNWFTIGPLLLRKSCKTLLVQHYFMKVTHKYGLVFNIDKCTVTQQQIPFFGNIYDGHGCHQDPAKVEAICAMP